MLDYHEDAVAAGADAQAAAYVQIRDDAANGSGGTLYGVGMDSDIVTASLKAVASAASRAASRAPARLEPERIAAEWRSTSQRRRRCSWWYSGPTRCRRCVPW